MARDWAMLGDPAFLADVSRCFIAIFTLESIYCFLFRWHIMAERALGM